MTEEIPLYPFPGDEILWERVPDGFEPSEDSYFALGKPPETKVRDFGEKTHENPFRLVVRSPLRGSIGYEINEGDGASLMAISLQIMAMSKSGMYGDPDDESQVVFNPDYWESLTGLDIEVVGTEGTE